MTPNGSIPGISIEEEVKMHDCASNGSLTLTVGLHYHIYKV